MTAARHARPRVRVRTLVDFAAVTAQAVIGMVAVLGLIASSGLGGNVPGARWHYPCRMHRAAGIEWFTPARDFWKGLCLQ